MKNIISRMGGKHYMAKRLLQRFPKHTYFCEVFGGGGHVLISKSNNPKDWLPNGYSDKHYKEIYNDLDSQLIAFWKYIKFHPQAFMLELEKYLHSRELHEYMHHKQPLTELEKAVWFFILNKQTFSGTGRFYNVHHGANLQKYKEHIEKISERLKTVCIECRDFAQLIVQLDKQKDVFFYLDPPYFGYEHYYITPDTPKFDRHSELAELLKTINGKFLLSYNDCPEIRALYSDSRFHIEEISQQYNADNKRGKSCKIVTELLISNYDYKI